MFIYHFAQVVVICFQISIFVLLETAEAPQPFREKWLWFAFKLVSLSYWKQQDLPLGSTRIVVICFQISIFVLLETAMQKTIYSINRLWFAFKLVSLSYWKQQSDLSKEYELGCDLLSN